MSVGNSHYAFGGFSLTLFAFEHLLEQAECYCRLGGGTRFGYNYDTEFLVRQIVHKLKQIIFTDILSGKNHLGRLRFMTVCCKTVRKSFDYSLGTEIRTAYAYCHHHLTFILK